MAGAQTATNVATAQANAILGNANEYSPLGSVKYNVIGYQDVVDPNNGAVHKIPKYERIVSLSPGEQALYDQQNQLSQKLNTLATQQTDKIGNIIGQPVSLEGLPDVPLDTEAYRQQVEAGMFGRLNPQLQRDYEALENRLVNQGLARGSQAFNEAMAEHGRNANDARTQILLASGEEARRAQAQQATSRERAFQERLQLRNQPINEISALMGGGQVTIPQFTPFRPAQMSETPVGQYYYQSAQLAQDAWKAQVMAQAQNNAGMYGLMGSGLGLFGKMIPMISDRRLKRDVEVIGQGFAGLPVYRFRYIWGDDMQTGYMADEVETVMPEAVSEVSGFQVVDYGKLGGIPHVQA